MGDKKAVVLLSGGIDSSTTMAIAIAEGYETHALSFDYGQRHHRELESARLVAGTLGAAQHIVIRFEMGRIGGSALTTDIEVPKREGMSPTEISACGTPQPSGSAIPVTYVPARNTIFLSFALAWAEVLEAPDLFIGANAVDYSGYPDCRPEYLTAFEAMANLATRVSIERRVRFRINAPLLLLSKAEIIRYGIALGLDYSLTWSCYDPQPPATQSLSDSVHIHRPCGKCDSCLYRAKGFAEAGIEDPFTPFRPSNKGTR